jgi:hypothetical protein
MKNIWEWWNNNIILYGPPFSFNRLICRWRVHQQWPMKQEPYQWMLVLLWCILILYCDFLPINMYLYPASCLEKCDEKWAYMFNVYKNQQSRQTGSKESDGSKNTTHNMVYLYDACDQISRALSMNACATLVYPNIVLWLLANKHVFIHRSPKGEEGYAVLPLSINKIGKQEVGIWWVQKHFPRYGVPIWSLWPNIRFLPSLASS